MGMVFSETKNETHAQTNVNVFRGTILETGDNTLKDPTQGQEILGSPGVMLSTPFALDYHQEFLVRGNLK